MLDTKKNKHKHEAEEARVSFRGEHQHKWKRTLSDVTEEQDKKGQDVELHHDEKLTTLQKTTVKQPP